MSRLDEAPPVRSLHDAFGRHLRYLRLSVTDRCNFRCAYCLPQGCSREERERPLSLAEIARLARAFAGLGFWKIRLTGGEPTLRPDVVDLVRTVAATPGVRRVGLTTNGFKIASLAPQLRAAGLTALNVSLDSLEPARFAALTGVPVMDRVVAGIEAAVEAGIPAVKLNAVLLGDVGDADLDRFLSWTVRMPLGVRFIELMETGENGAFFARHHVPAEIVEEKLRARGWTRAPRDPESGPAVVYRHADHAGTAGVVAPYGRGFCDTCNRLRVSCTGQLKLCLFGDRQIPLRHLLQSDDQQEALGRLVESSVRGKPAAHLLKERRFGTTPNLAATGDERASSRSNAQ